MIIWQEGAYTSRSGTGRMCPLTRHRLPGILLDPCPYCKYCRSSSLTCPIPFEPGSPCQLRSSTSIRRAVKFSSPGRHPWATRTASLCSLRMRHAERSWELGGTLRVAGAHAFQRPKAHALQLCSAKSVYRFHRKSGPTHVSSAHRRI